MTDSTPNADSPSPSSDTGGATPADAEGLSLEDRLRRLDEIVNRLEGGEVHLEAGLALFEEGVRHVREAEALLGRAELRVEELVGEAESATTEPLDGGLDEADS